MIAKIFAVGSVAAMLLAGCCDKHCEENAQDKQTALPERTFEPLSLWNAHAPAKDSLEAFVRATTDSNSPDFIPAERRIAFLTGTERSLWKRLRPILTGCFLNTGVNAWGPRILFSALFQNKRCLRQHALRPLVQYQTFVQSNKFL